MKVFDENSPLFQAQRPEQSVMQALESLSDSQVSTIRKTPAKIRCLFKSREMPTLSKAKAKFAGEPPKSEAEESLPTSLVDNLDLCHLKLTAYDAALGTTFKCP